MKRIGIIGDKDSVLCFKAAGFAVFITEDEKKAEDILKKAVGENFAVMFITEQLMEKIPEAVNKFKASPELAVIPLPGKTGSLGIGMGHIKSAVEKAVGADILK